MIRATRHPFVKAAPRLLGRTFAGLAVALSLWSGPVLATQGMDVSMLLENHILAENPADLPEGARLQFYLPDDAPLMAAGLNVVEYDMRQGRFATIVETLDGTEMTLRGRFAAVIDVPVPIRPIMPGETAKAEDFTYKTVPALGLGAYVLTDLSQIEGKEVRRVLTQGRAVASQSLQPVRVVKRGEKLTLNYTQGGLMLNAPARALEDGELGAVVRVQNLNSNKIVLAIARGDGTAEVTP